MKTTVEIKKMGINGEGIGYINRKIVFIKGALLNEEVEIDAKQYNNKNYYFAHKMAFLKVYFDNYTVYHKKTDYIQICNSLYLQFAQLSFFAFLWS